MKRKLFLAATAAVSTLLSPSIALAQTDADNFYQSNSVRTEKVSFSNQYKMKVTAVPGMWTFTTA